MAARGKPIAAAGGVVWREHNGRHHEVAVIHRPRYDDWSLPKGKLIPDESELDAAVREVREEIGAEVVVGRRIGRISYLVDADPKTVAYWAMRYASGDFRPSDEVDDLRWLPIGEALERLTHGPDRRILDSFRTLPVPDSMVILLRHAKAGKRTEWRGDDRERPLDFGGRRQAQSLALTLRLFAPDRILSADRVRCVESVEPLAALCDIRVEVVPELSDEAYLDDPDAALTTVLSLAKPGTTSVISSQGTAVPGLLDDLNLQPAPATTATRKGAFWALSFADGGAISADLYDRDSY